MAASGRQWLACAVEWEWAALAGCSAPADPVESDRIESDRIAASPPTLAAAAVQRSAVQLIHRPSLHFRDMSCVLTRESDESQSERATKQEAAGSHGQSHARGARRHGQWAAVQVHTGR